MQERCNSIANALELHLSCTNTSKYWPRSLAPHGIIRPKWVKWPLCQCLVSYDARIPTLLRFDFCSPFNGLMQERRNSLTNTLQLRLSCIKPSTYRLDVDDESNTGIEQEILSHTRHCLLHHQDIRLQLSDTTHAILQKLMLLKLKKTYLYTDW